MKQKSTTTFNIIIKFLSKCKVNFTKNYRTLLIKCVKIKGQREIIGSEDIYAKFIVADSIQEEV